jgi:hypothetical protein
MKALNIIQITLISSILFVSTAFGKNGPNASSNILSVRDQIGASLREVSVDNIGIVYIYFKASPKDGFKLLQVLGSDNDLIQTVKRHLAKGNFVIPDGMAGNYILKIKFDDDRYFNKSVVSDEVLKHIVSDALPKINVPKGSITLYFNVDGNKLDVEKVDGTEKSLVSIVENSFNNSTIILPDELTGQNYKVDVKF